MKRLAFLGAIAPGTALAHGGHLHVPEAAHGAVHAGPWALAALLTIAGGLAVWRARRR